MVPSWLPAVDVDRLLVGRVLANLLENADRHAPPQTPIIVAADLRAGRAVISVTDPRPGVPPAEGASLSDSFARCDTGGRSGLGLALAKTFVEAHGQHIWVEDVPGGNVRFVFTRPVVASHGAGR